jgi:hypothetical protein
MPSCHDNSSTSGGLHINMLLMLCSAAAVITTMGSAAMSHYWRGSVEAVNARTIFISIVCFQVEGTGCRLCVTAAQTITVTCGVFTLLRHTVRAVEFVRALTHTLQVGCKYVLRSVCLAISPMAAV